MANPRGIDLSHNNGLINIAGLPADIAFVSIKLGQGLTEQDPDFQTFYHELRDQRPEIVRIPYFFFDPRFDGVAQAKNALSRGVNYTESGTGPMMVDIEGDDGGPMDQWTAENYNQAIQNIVDFINYVKANCGRQELLFYTFDSYVHNVLKGHIFPNTTLWVASYQSTPPPYIPGWPYKLWQYSETGQTDGATTGGSYDLDQFMGTQAELDALANKG